MLSIMFFLLDYNGDVRGKESTWRCTNKAWGINEIRKIYTRTKGSLSRDVSTGRSTGNL